MYGISSIMTCRGNGTYTMATRFGVFAYIHDDFGNLVPANGVTYLIGL